MFADSILSILEPNCVSFFFFFFGIVAIAALALLCIQFPDDVFLQTSRSRDMVTKKNEMM